tara:strand:- start:1524 stop:1955 length:432 start_codon:yes stop_codon:yes gene_type:complete
MLGMKIRNHKIIQLATSIIFPLLGLDFLVDLCDTLTLKLTDNKRKKPMSNYTTKMIATMDDRSPITRAVADDLAAEFGLPVRSVISKAVLLGLYQKPQAKASSSRTTKAEIVKAIENALQGENLDGLEGASMRSLSALLMSIQ